MELLHPDGEAKIGSAAFGPSPSDLQVDVEADRIVVRTSAAAVRRTRLGACVLCLLAAGVGLALLPTTLFGAALALVGAAGAFFLPWRIRPGELLEVRPERGTLLVRQPQADAGATVALAEIARVRGDYTVHGWDPEGVLSLELRDGRRVTALVLPGSDERTVEQACGLLARLTDRPATFVPLHGRGR
jgi:hypothetical protein